MITGPTVAPIGDLAGPVDPTGPGVLTGGTISVTLEEMPAIADGLDAVSRTCADRTMPILGIATETRLFLGINGRAQQAAAICAVLAADLGMSAAKFGVTAATVRAAHSSYLQVENTVAGWFEFAGKTHGGKLPDGRSSQDYIRGLIARGYGNVTYFVKLTIPELGYFAASRTLPFSPLTALALFGAAAYFDAKWNPEIARPRIASRFSAMTGLPQEFIEKVLEKNGVGIVGPLHGPEADKRAYSVSTTSAEKYGVAAHRGEKSQLSVGASSDRLQAAAKAQDQEFERSQQDASRGERGAVLVTVMYEAGHEGDPAHALYVVSIPGTNFNSWGGSPIDPAGAMRETLGEDTTRNPAYQMVLQALRDAGAPQGARVYMEGFSQGAMIAYNMANSLEVAKEINIVGIYAQGTPLRGLPAKRRGFAVDYVEGEGDIVPDSALRDEGGWRPDGRDTAITVQNPEHDGGKYREALEREGYSGAVFGGMRAAMDGKEYVLGEQKVTSGSAMPDGYSSAERKGVTLARLGTYIDRAHKSGVKFDEKGIDEAIEQGTGGKVKGLQDIRNRVERVQQTAEYAGEKFNKTFPAVIEGVQKTIPHPEPTPQESQNPQPAWPETPMPQMPKVPLLQGYNPQHLPPAIKMPGDLSRPEPAPIKMPGDLSRPEPAPIKMPARIEAEGQLPPASLIPPDILPKPADLHTHIEKVVTQPIIDQLQLPNAGSVLKNPPIFGAGQGGDYDGVESLIPALPNLKPAPMLPPKSIDPGFLAPTPPENIDPGFRAPGPPEDLTPIEEREPLMV